MIKVIYKGKGTIDFNLHDNRPIRLSTNQFVKVEGSLAVPKIKNYYKQLRSLDVYVADITETKPEPKPVLPVIPASEEKKEEVKEEVEEPVPTKDDLMKMMASELKAKANSLGIELYGNENKSLIADKIIAALKK